MSLSSLPRLRRRSRFKKVFSSGKTVVGKGVVLYVLPSENGKTQVGFSAGKKLGKAVKRNRIKRRVKEALRASLGKVQEGLWIVIIARGRAYDMPFGQLVADIEECLKKAGAFGREPS